MRKMLMALVVFASMAVGVEACDVMFNNKCLLVQPTGRVVHVSFKVFYQKTNSTIMEGWVMSASQDSNDNWVYSIVAENGMVFGSVKARYVISSEAVDPSDSRLQCYGKGC